MVLTDRQRADLHAGIYEYLLSRPGPAYSAAALAVRAADPEACERFGTSNSNANAPSSKDAAPAAATTTTPQQQPGHGSTTPNNTNGYSHKNNNGTTPKTTTIIPLLEKKWTAIPRLQKKVLELEKQAAQSAKIHAHRGGGNNDAINNILGGGGAAANNNTCRMLPRNPPTHCLAGHSMVVTCCAIHPIFTLAVSGSEDGTIKVWDHESGDYIRTMKGHTNTVNGVKFSPTGTHMVSCSTDLSIKLWDVATYACLRTLRGHDHTISAVVFLPAPSLFSTTPSTSGDSASRVGGTGVSASVAGSQHVLSASRDATVKLWDVETGFCDATFSDHNDWVRCLAVRQSDGALWASSGNDQVIIVYEQHGGGGGGSSATSHRKLVELRGHEHVIESIAFISEEPLKNGSTVRSSSSHVKHTEMVRDYLASGSRDRTVRVWQISQGSCLATFKAHENWVRSVLIHPSGLYVISGSDDKTIRVFDIKNNRCLRTLENAHAHFVTSVDMHHTLPMLVSGSVDQTLRCWLLQ